ncbi:MAG: DoxX family protein [Bacteriovoracaceae bacterium]|nr:DoxX family protein [Bacteriovoracaceae bacterium]
MRRDIGLLILRAATGLMMLVGHGWSKLVNFGQIAPSFPNPFGIGGSATLAFVIFAEVFCAIAVIAGIFTRYAVIPLIITMLGAALVIHGVDPWSKKEMSLLFLVPFVTLFFTGAGDLSVDKFRTKA